MVVVDQFPSPSSPFPLAPSLFFSPIHFHQSPLPIFSPLSFFFPFFFFFCFLCKIFYDALPSVILKNHIFWYKLLYNHNIYMCCPKWDVKAEKIKNRTFIYQTFVHLSICPFSRKRFKMATRNSCFSNANLSLCGCGRSLAGKFAEWFYICVSTLQVLCVFTMRVSVQHSGSVGTGLTRSSIP